MAQILNQRRPVMHIESFTNHPQHLEFIVSDGPKQALMLLEKRSGQVSRAEAVGGSDVASCESFANEVAAWLNAHAKPKYLARSATAA